jgi:hypothetical protein
MTFEADPPSTAGTPPAPATGLPLYKRIYYAGVIILVAGLIGAALIYVFSADAASGPGGEIFNRQHYEFQIERMGGKMMVYLVRFNEWFFSLWQGRQLAYTVGVLSIVIALACFWFADLVSVPLPGDRNEDRES